MDGETYLRFRTVGQNIGLSDDTIEEAWQRATKADYDLGFEASALLLLMVGGFDAARKSGEAAERIAALSGRIDDALGALRALPSPAATDSEKAPSRSLKPDTATRLKFDEMATGVSEVRTEVAGLRQLMEGLREAQGIQGPDLPTAIDAEALAALVDKLQRVLATSSDVIDDFGADIEVVLAQAKALAAAATKGAEDARDAVSQVTAEVPALLVARVEQTLDAKLAEGVQEAFSDRVIARVTADLRKKVEAEAIEQAARFVKSQLDSTKTRILAAAIVACGLTLGIGYASGFWVGGSTLAGARDRYAARLVAPDGGLLTSLIAYNPDLRVPFGASCTEDKVQIIAGRRACNVLVYLSPDASQMGPAARATLPLVQWIRTLPLWVFGLGCAAIGAAGVWAGQRFRRQ